MSNGNVTHLAPTEKRAAQRAPMCGYAGPDDAVSTDLSVCTCVECLDWARPVGAPPAEAPTA